jgi:hypothetical protein
MDPEQLRIASARLLEDAGRSRAGDASELVEQMLGAEYWRQLNPHLTIEGDHWPDETESRPLSEPELETVTRHVTDRGYFHTTEVVSTDLLARLVQAVESARREGWPGTTCFVYDEFWQVSRTPSADALLRGTLGEGYSQIPKVWCHYVNPTKRAQGWGPHIDGPADEARRQPRNHRLTLWVPLTEATLDNGCIYLIPRDLEPPEGLSQADLPKVLVATRALPARPGELLGWDHYTMHWGSSVSRNDVPVRVSLSFEFLSAAATPFADEQPLLGMNALPSFEQRLRFIAAGVSEYVKFEPMLALQSEVFRQIRESLVD